MKYQLWENDDMLYQADNSELFSFTVATQYPLGSFVRVDDFGYRIVMTFENFWINIYK